MSHRVTIKELQERLDEMKKQRDEAREQCTKLANELGGARKTIETFRMDAHEVAECHDFLDAYDARHRQEVETCNRAHLGQAIAYSVASVANDRIRLSNRVAGLLIAAAIGEGKLLQADAIRTFVPPLPDPPAPPFQQHY